ncbi:PAS domain-containing protein [Colidextribacter sp. OB.20]|uniref:sensor histidine kinase n=1 Tax=Colidextribacter sp. OB.20 TaxID=2304568 RepID=UPI001371AC47|nr:ATP-binding protein [Colidextribacter sp. OB.20]NBI10165.1 PAS domain-containing protein [Colidextribacter sp. OB.20]
MTKKIFRSILCVAAAVLLANLVIVMGCLYDYFGSVQETQLKDELRLAAYGVEENGPNYLEHLSERDYRYAWTPDYRLTWVASDGTVLFDTLDSAENMENHADRVEVREAFAKGESSSVRYSTTLTERTLYYAKTLNDGTVLRISIRQATVLALVLVMLQPILLVAILAVILSAALANWMSKKIVRPLNSLDLDHPLENDAYEELAPLLSRIHQQRQQIAAQLHSLKKQTDEFAQVTSHMKEGLVLLDNAGKILSINPAAQQVFGAESSCDGQDFLTIDRSRDLHLAIQTAAEEGHGEIRSERNGREFQFDISRIESEDAFVGTVLLAFDVTEQAFAEQNRREFTANVSHELKTPLQSITGSAELLENGLVKPEDVPRFVGMIRTEAARLVTLVDDIIHLSQLDEGAAPDRETVDLLETAKDAASALGDSATEKGIHVSVSGESVSISGVRSFLHEMIYNLCDNAIKYNVENGSVEITVVRKEQEAVVTVKDTGIGIPAEHQSRIFERFFRVDKSRSKASGGTGLGLSIVKHIAQYHGATIKLQSEFGCGTTVSVVFPL